VTRMTKKAMNQTHQTAKCVDSSPTGLGRNRNGPNAADADGPYATDEGPHDANGAANHTLYLERDHSEEEKECFQLEPLL